MNIKKVKFHFEYLILRFLFIFYVKKSILMILIINYLAKNIKLKNFMYAKSFLLKI